MAIVIIGMASAVLLLWLPVALRGQQLQKLEREIQALSPKKAELDQLQQVIHRLRSQQEAFQGLQQGQRRWSKRLNTLSTHTPEGVWFTEFVLDPARGLIIQGAAIGQGGAEMVSIGRLVQELKNDADFAAAVKDIQIESIKRAQDREIEIVQFTLTCSLSSGSAS
ncbi:MAG: PilN domain-containing protein [Candidatus Omnitrophota bacterium]|nr:PilN domain-containing protein [Candidatus Omnitrophota bacterium]